jgi:hypothetical protein
MNLLVKGTQVAALDLRKVLLNRVLSYCRSVLGLLVDTIDPISELKPRSVPTVSPLVENK